jgi:putative phage-type endonuclease
LGKALSFSEAESARGGVMDGELQRTEEWFLARLGKVTASRIADVMAKTKTGYSTSRANYMAQIVAERLTGKQQESYSNAAMQWGTDTEPLARAAWENEMGLMVIETGFHDHPNIPMSGASPDGLVGDKGLIEIKCPNTATHIDYLISKELPRKYWLQMQWQMACTDRDHCYFVMYDPRMPERHQLRSAWVGRDDKEIKEIEEEVTKFLDEVQETINKLEAA